MGSAKHMLYFALQPPPEVAAQALALAEEARGAHRLSGKPMAAGRLHVSLNNVGEFKHPPGSVIAKALAAVQHVSLRPFVIELNRLVSWSRADGQHTVALSGEDGVIGVHDLYATLHKALGRVDFAPRRMAEITPHMTLLYDRTEVPERFVEPVSWRATEFVLIHAAHGEGRFEVAGRIPLSG